MDLRDQLAMRFAAALVDAFQAPEHISRRAYDLAEAMLRERARRIDADEEQAIRTEPPMDELEPVMDEELERWLTSADDPSWEQEEKARPGLARTQATEEAPRKERSAG